MREYVSLLDLLNRSVNENKLPTGSAHLDQLLGGGVEFGKLTEVYGEAGSGKTQFGLQLAVNLANLNHEILMIDTEGKICPRRIAEIAKQAANKANITDRIYIRRCTDIQSLVAVVDILPILVKSKVAVKGIIIDSIAHLFRYSGPDEDHLKKTGLLFRLSQKLGELAHDHSLAVLLTNQITTRIGDNNSISELTPALGESWKSAVPVRLLFTFPLEADVEDLDLTETAVRKAVLEKSPSSQPASCLFSLASCGVCDVS